MPLFGWGAPLLFAGTFSASLDGFSSGFLVSSSIKTAQIADFFAKRIANAMWVGLATIQRNSNTFQDIR